MSAVPESAAWRSAPGSSLPVEVVAAVITRADGAVLFAQRPEGKVYAGWWEFPGGKVEQGENGQQALARELNEELGIQVRRAFPWLTRVYTYPHATVRLRFFRVTAWDGEPHPREMQALAWQRMDAPLVEPMLPANAPIVASLRLPPEYAISPGGAMGEDAFLSRLESRLAGGLRLVQVREKAMTRECFRVFARKVIALGHRYGARVLLNATEAVVRELGADGMHLGSSALMAMSLRPAELLVAASCHDATQLEHAMRLGLDFAVLGPVGETASHPGAPVLGWERFAGLVADATIPVYAIGGMTRNQLDNAWLAGAHGIAMITGAWARNHAQDGAVGSASSSGPDGSGTR
jgi:8-oxo-dGTP diphosphatase